MWQKLLIQQARNANAAKAYDEFRCKQTFEAAELSFGINEAANSRVKEENDKIEGV